MQLTTQTEPITGLDFKALRDDLGNLTIDTAFNGVIKAIYDPKTDSYTFPTHLFEEHPTMTLNECAEYLGVSKVRVSRMCSNGTLRAVKIRGSLIIDAESAEHYKEG